MSDIDTPLLTSINGLNGLNNINNINSMSYNNPYMYSSYLNYPSYTTPHQIINQLQSTLQLQIFEKFSSGYFVIDTILHLLTITFITYTMSQLKNLLDNIGYFIKWLSNKLYSGTKYIYYKIDRKPVKKLVKATIPQITDNRTINELYKAVHWYLSNNRNVEHPKEHDLQYVYEKKIIPENVKFILDNANVNKIPNQKKTTNIKFKSYTISFSFDRDIITIYTDREKKRENSVIKLWCEIDETYKSDIMEEFCNLCITEYVKSLSSSTWKQMIYVNKNGKWTGEESHNTRKIDTVILQGKLKNDILNDMELFINSEEWYQHRDIPYTRGYMFYGYPGTGKTSLIKALSLHFKRHIHTLALQNVSNDIELNDLFKAIPYKDTILVIEDIDAMISIVKSREEKLNEESDNESDNESDDESDENKDKKKDKKKNKKESKKSSRKEDTPAYKKNDYYIEQNNNTSRSSAITLSGLLNVLDGFMNCNGRILIMTTNHPQVLDEALTRPGRCDASFQFNNCNKEQIGELYEMFFNLRAPIEQLNNIKLYEYSPAHITSVFLRYRNLPHEALNHLDDVERKITIKPIVELKNDNNIELKDNNNTNNNSQNNLNKINSNPLEALLNTLPAIDNNMNMTNNMNLSDEMFISSLLNMPNQDNNIIQFDNSVYNGNISTNEEN